MKKKTLKCFKELEKGWKEILKSLKELGKEGFNNKILKVMEFFILGEEGVDPISITFSKRIFKKFRENCKDKQNCLIHPEKLRLKILIIGVGQTS